MKIAAFWLLFAILLPASLQAEGRAVEACTSMEVFVREGCPHCANAKKWLAELTAKQPQLHIQIADVMESPPARDRFLALSKEHGVERPGVPAFFICGEFIVGFGYEAGTDQQILSALGVSEDGNAMVVRTPFGEFDVSDWGLPALTVLLGLVDGFNPCAMWVLLFLLSILVNIKSRARIVLIAGTFVLVSGLVYFAFMAAWLNVFLMMGYLRWLQLLISVLAIGVGVIHIKDFFALKKGVSLSIPESAKPTLYARVRRVVQAENLFAAMASVTVVAILVNLIELLCTAGIPAIYTQILSQQELPAASYYGYLGLYNLAYIFDDGLMVAIVVTTMSRHKLQEKQGQWLKLISGAVILVLGLLLLLKPEWLF